MTPIKLDELGKHERGLQMQIGIDFGTSYSAAGAIRDGQVELIRFGEEKQFRTAVFFPQEMPNVDSFELTSDLKRDVDAMVRAGLREQANAQARAAADLEAAKKIRGKEEREKAMQMVRKATSRTAEDFRSDAVRAVRRQWYAEQAAHEVRPDLQTALFGEDAVDAYVSERGGSLVVSPKSMLGYKLHGRASATLLGITSSILRHIRMSASQQFGTSVTEVLMGRPVEFRSSMGPAGTTQALEMLTEAGLAAGFDRVEFMDEPSAAAWTFHEDADQTHRALIVDVGGGTTDIALADVGGTLKRPSILRSWGMPTGGSDVDLHLSLFAFMPLFGKGSTVTPVHHYYEASAVHDLQRQASFLRTSFNNVDEPYGERLGQLQSHGATTRLNRAVERTKILLSSKNSATVRLGYIEEDLSARVSRSTLDAAAEYLTRPLRTLLEKASNEMGEAPERVYLTGGMSRAPYVQDAVAGVFPGISMQLGDASLAVVSGLARACEKR